MSLFSFSDATPAAGATQNYPSLMSVSTAAQATTFKNRYAAWTASGSRTGTGDSGPPMPRTARQQLRPRRRHHRRQPDRVQPARSGPWRQPLPRDRERDLLRERVEGGSGRVPRRPASSRSVSVPAPRAQPPPSTFGRSRALSPTTAPTAPSPTTSRRPITPPPAPRCATWRSATAKEPCPSPSRSFRARHPSAASREQPPQARGGSSRAS